MTQALANDPMFAELAKELNETGLEGGMGGLNLQEGSSAGGAGAAAAAAGAIAPGGDPFQAKYMEAMEKVMGNPEFVQAAQEIGKNLMGQLAPQMPPEFQSMMDLYSNPSNMEIIKEKMEELKDDPQLADVFKDIEANGQQAMFKYMDNPEITAKFQSKFDDLLKDPRVIQQDAALTAGTTGTGGESQAVEEGPPSIHEFATSGDPKGLKEALKAEGVSPDDLDDESHTALHFASGYGELECMKILLDAGANVDITDESGNTALHYAAGYGQVEAVKLLLEKGIDKEAKNDEEKTALDVAELNEEASVIALLK